MRDKYKSFQKNKEASEDVSTDISPQKGSETPGILKSVKVPTSVGGQGSLAKPKANFGSKSGTSVLNRSKSKNRSPSPVAYMDPRQ